MQYEHLPLDLVVGIEAIDQDHDHLFSFVNLFRAAKAGGDVTQIKSVVLALAAYTDYHFIKEEIGFEACDFADAADHIREHRELRATVLGLQKDLDDRPEIFDAGKLAEMDRFFTDWLDHHVRHSDMAYKAFFDASPEALEAIETYPFTGYLAEDAGDLDILGDPSGKDG